MSRTDIDGANVLMSEHNQASRFKGVEVDFDVIFRQIEQLHELASDAAAAGNSDRRYDFSVRWGVLLSGRLQRLVHYAGDDELSPAQQRRFAELRTALHEAAPIAQRLGVADPIRALRGSAPDSQP